MTVFTDTWDSAFEASPADTDLKSQGASKMRQLRSAVQEREEVDHSWAGDANDGEHKKITFGPIPLTVDPTNVANKGFLYTKDVGGKVELFWIDEDGNIIQITSVGVLSAVIDMPTLVKSADYTVVAGDVGKLILASGATTITLLAAATAGDSFVIAIKKTDSANTITIDGNAAETIDGALTIVMGAQHSVVLLVCDGSNWHIVAGHEATQIELEAETAVGAFATPDFIKYNPGVVKFWCNFDGFAAGPITPRVDLNVTDVTDNSTGNYTVNIDTDFSGADYSVVTGGNILSGSVQRTLAVSPYLLAAGACSVQCKDDQNLVKDAAICCVAGLGDQ